MDETFRIQAYLRRAASHGRDTARIGPFQATFNRESANPYLNYALPDDGATPSPDDVDALIAAYRHRGRRPRLEYLPGIAPALEPALLDRGFSVEGRLPLMVCRPGSGGDLPVPPGMELIVPATDEDLAAMLTVQHEAYDDLPPGPADLARLRGGLDAGGLAVLAREAATGEPVGAGGASVPDDATTEIAGIGVRTAYRRRGVAGAIVARLLREATAAGITRPFLMAASEAEARSYGRAGFVEVARILHVSVSGDEP